jgi:hypothetical protein
MWDQVRALEFVKENIEAFRFFLYFVIFAVNNKSIVKPVLRGHFGDKEKVVFKGS